jgi:wyosine [tRNA(Phe)-imidazoG37] synthetase (radical SAM superfamily)
MARKSWVVVEVTTENGEETFKPLAGTEDARCIARILNSMKLYKDEVAKTDRAQQTIIHTTVVDDVEMTNPAIADSLNQSGEEKVDAILGMVDMG